MRRHRAVYLALTIAAWLAAMLCTLGTAAGVVNLTDGRDGRHDGGVGVGIAAVVLVAVLAAAAGWLGLVCEHRFRDTSALPDQAVLHSSVVTAAEPPLRHRDRHPIATGFLLLVLVGVTFGAPINFVSTFVSFERSQSTQHHGIRATVFIVAVDNTSTPCNYYSLSCSDTASARAQLFVPIHGRHRTTIHAAGKIAQGPDTVGHVLLDPYNLAYAEFPGDPLDDVGNLVTAVYVWVILWGLVLGGFEENRARRRRRSRHRAQSH